MKPIVINIIAMAALLTTASALATDMPLLAKKHGCIVCHAIDKRIIGPSWMEISKAYNNNTKTSMGIPISDILRKKTPEEYMKMRITGGGAGTWGVVMMPPTDPAHIWQDKMDLMIKGIIGLSKGKTPKEELLNLTNQYSCQACHSMDKKDGDIGPSWMDISGFYNNSLTSPYGLKVSDVLKSMTAEEWLLHKIAHGGLGYWGMMLMPAIEYRALPDSVEMKPEDKYPEFKELIRFILDLAKK